MQAVLLKMALAALLIATSVAAEGFGEYSPGGSDLAQNLDFSSEIKTFERDMTRSNLGKNIFIFGQSGLRPGNGLIGLGSSGEDNILLNPTLLQDNGLRTLPRFQSEGKYFQNHVDQPDYFTGDNRFSFLDDDEALLRELTPYTPCPYCVFLGQEPSAIEVAALMDAASIASSPAGFLRKEIESCPSKFATIDFLVQPLDECLLPVVALTISSNNHTKDKVVCSGTIVGPDHVLTAAHCACRGVTDIYFGTAIPQFHVGLEWRSFDGPNGFAKFYDDSHKVTFFANRRAVEGAPIFFGDEKTLCDAFATNKAIPPKLVPYDIALLPLARGEQHRFSQSATANLPALGVLLGDQADVLIAGFGPDGNVRARQVVKRYAYSKVRSFSDNIINVGTKGRQVSTCSGDSGSGVYSVEGKRLVIHGVLSNGMSDCTSDNPISNFASIGRGSDAYAWLIAELSQ